MEITHHDDDKKGAFEAMIDGKAKGELTYVWSGKDRIIADHTSVDSELEGQGVGAKLFHKLIEWAKAEKVTIIPLCPFVKAMMDKKPDEYKDLRAS